MQKHIHHDDQLKVMIKVDRNQFVPLQKNLIHAKQQVYILLRIEKKIIVFHSEKKNPRTSTGLPNSSDNSISY